MKKLLVALLALSCIGFGGFAQAAAPTVAWSGYASAGLQVGSDDSIVQKNIPNSGKNYRMRLTGVVADGDFGAKFRFQATAFAQVDYTQALVYGTFFNKMLKFKLGKLDDYTWATPWNAYGTFDGQKGVQLIVMPVAGMSAGLFVPATETSSKLSDAFKAAALGMAYSMDKTFNMVAGASLFGTTRSAYASFSLTAVENLGLQVEANFADLSKIEPVVDLDLSYAMAPLTVTFHNTDTIASTLAWSVDPGVTYALNDMVTLGADFSYDSANAYQITADAALALSANTAAKAYVWYDGKAVTANFSYDVSF